MLQGSEVKSLREGKAQLNEAYARVDGGEMWLFEMHIPPWEYATGVRGPRPGPQAQAAAAPGADRRAAWARPSSSRSPSIPLSIYFKDGRAKVELALAKGRRLYDKRHVIMARDAEREAARATKEIGRWDG